MGSPLTGRFPVGPRWNNLTEMGKRLAKRPWALPKISRLIQKTGVDGRFPQEREKTPSWHLGVFAGVPQNGV